MRLKIPRDTGPGASAPRGPGPLQTKGIRSDRETDAAASVDPSRFQGAVAAVILPTLNEEKGLARTLAELPLARFEEPGYRVVPLVIDGGSTDRTVEVAREWGIPVLRQTSRGKGAAVIEAIRWVHHQRIPFVVVLDADATYPPDRILPTLDLLRGGTDLVIGVRRPEWGPPRDVRDLVHRVGNLIFSYTSSLLSRRTILDLCSGFWGVSTERFLELGLRDTTFAIESELVLQSVRRGLSLQQIPIPYRERIGVAKLRALRDGGHILLAILENARPGPRPSGTDTNLAPWNRDLLSIGLSLGISGAVIECGPADAVEAAGIARFLRRNLPATRLQVGANEGERVLAGGPARVAWPSPEDDPARPDPPFVVSVPSGGSVAGDARSVMVSIRNHRTRLTIALPSDDAGTAPGPAPGGPLSRAGGWIGASLPRREQFPSLLVVTSRLNFEPGRQQQTLLAANGFRVVAQSVAKPVSSTTATLEAVAPAASSGQ